MKAHRLKPWLVGLVSVGVLSLALRLSLVSFRGLLCWFGWLSGCHKVFWHWREWALEGVLRLLFGSFVRWSRLDQRQMALSGASHLSCV